VWEDRRPGVRRPLSEIAKSVPRHQICYCSLFRPHLFVSELDLTHSQLVSRYSEPPKSPGVQAASREFEGLCNRLPLAIGALGFVVHAGGPAAARAVAASECVSCPRAAALTSTARHAQPLLRPRPGDRDAIAPVREPREMHGAGKEPGRQPHQRKSKGFRQRPHPA